MLVLYKSIGNILRDDDALKLLLGGDVDDPHIYQTYVQFHSEAAVRNHHWVTFNKLSDVADDTEQTQAIREIRLEIHVFGRDTDSDRLDQIEDHIRSLLDGANIATEDMLAFFCLQEGPSTRNYEVDQKVWHSVSVYHCKVAAVALLPT
jgi:hypothetical protein